MFQTQQIEDIISGGHRLARAVDAAAALSACGFAIRYKKLQNRTETHTWFVDERVGEANELLLRTQIHSGPESLQVRNPEHPFLAGLYAVRSLRALRRWFAEPGLPPSAEKPSAVGRLLFLASRRAPDDLMPLLWNGTEQAQHTITVRTPADEAFLAAAAVCGFPPRPRIYGDREPMLDCAAQSLTFPGLRLEHFYELDIPGAPAGGPHAFTVAVNACLVWQTCLNRMDKERRKTLLLRSRFSQRTALISAELYGDTSSHTSGARQQIDEHLASV